MDNNPFLTLTKEIQNLLDKDFSFQNYEILTKKITNLDNLMKEDKYNKYTDIYENIHEQYGNYRWINYL